MIFSPDLDTMAYPEWIIGIWNANIAQASRSPMVSKTFPFSVLEPFGSRWTMENLGTWRLE